jgi:hypothetical protein
MLGLGCSSLAEHLPSMHKALDSILSTKNKKEKKIKNKNATGEQN